jgi:hypothetical protein
VNGKSGRRREGWEERGGRRREVGGERGGRGEGWEERGGGEKGRRRGERKGILQLQETIVIVSTRSFPGFTSILSLDEKVNN